MARACRPRGYWVADGGSKTFDEALGGALAGALDQGRQPARQGDDGRFASDDVGGHLKCKPSPRIGAS
jgi:hypothetical protein